MLSRGMAAGCFVLCSNIRPPATERGAQTVCRPGGDRVETGPGEDTHYNRVKERKRRPHINPDPTWPEFILNSFPE